ncbi:amino acid/polyamine transporter I [Aspergillus tamarii]|uniref:Amino acid/polyamine transporter I n=1 Tax=Aspergillus tamarii TaxID=41984 RepID=A0A5N6UD81_ASPTM|nr:amino acid/polyamine transporter I [Aspergillus tamarii]
MLEPVGGQPLVQLLNATSSLALTNVGISLVILCFCLAGASALVSWSRLYWSFSREGALPFSRTMSKLTSRHGVPLNVLLWNTLLCLALGTVNISSTTAMNALFGASGLCSNTSLIGAMGLALWNGRDRLDNCRWLNLGRWGNAIFWVALVWSVLMCVAISMPLYLPVTPTTMNWASAVFLGFAFISGVYWVCLFEDGSSAVY